MRLIIFLCLVWVSNGAPADNRKEDIRPDHLEGLPLEKDGQLNHEMRQEILLGNGDLSGEELKKAVEGMMKESDMNDDGRLSPFELEQRIVTKRMLHLDESESEARGLAEKVDLDKNAKISWEEYKPHFIKSKGLEHSEKTGEVIGQDATHRLEDEKAEFYRADVDRDAHLNEYEWRVFLHPESSSDALIQFATEQRDSFDKDRDGFVSRKEFVDPHPGEVLDETMQKIEENDRKEREREFTQDMDRNGDGKADLEEITSYLDPRSIESARREVRDLMQIADMDGDGFLSRTEILSKQFLLQDTSLFDVKARLHYDL